MPIFRIIPSTVQQNRSVSPGGWNFPLPDINSPEMAAEYAKGNCVLVETTPGADAFYENPIDVNAPVLTPAASVVNNVFPITPFRRFLQGDYRNGDPTSGTSTASVDMDFTTDFPDEYDGDPSAFFDVVRNATEPGSNLFSVMKSDPLTQLMQNHNVCDIPFSPSGPTYTCPVDQNHNFDTFTDLTPNFGIRFAPGLDGETATAFYALMNGTGDIRVWMYDNAVDPPVTDQIVPAGDDATALATIASIYESQVGMPMPEGGVGFMTFYFSRRATEFSINGMSDDVFDWDGIVSPMEPGDGTGFSAFPSNNAIYDIFGGDVPPGGLPVFGFNFPTGSEQDSQFLRWARPPFETRIPFQNYTFSVPRIVFRKEK